MTRLLPEKVCSNSLKPYSFYVMESRVSSDYTRKINRIFMLEKEVNRKKNAVGKIAKRQ